MVTLSLSAELDGIHVLLVDDEVLSRDMLAVFLGDAGAQVTVAGSAAEALGAFERTPPDVLVSDIGLPLEDGYSLLRSVRSREASCGGNVVAVSMSGYGRDPQQVRFDGHLTKPIAVPALVTMLRRLLRDRAAGPVTPNDEEGSK